MSATRIATVREIIQRGGGPRRLHERSEELFAAGAATAAIAEKTIYSWLGSGIPEKHWSFVGAECRVTPADLHAANELIRAKEARTRVA